MLKKVTLKKDRLTNFTVYKFLITAKTINWSNKKATRQQIKINFLKTNRLFPIKIKTNSINNKLSYKNSIKIKIIKWTRI
jgi:hypothetical protein